jgi:hypothetical protein
VLGCEPSTILKVNSKFDAASRSTAHQQFAPLQYWEKKDHALIPEGRENAFPAPGSISPASACAAMGRFVSDSHGQRHHRHLEDLRPNLDEHLRSVSGARRRQLVTIKHQIAIHGDQSPLVKLDPKEPRGFGQSGIAVRKDRSYTGRIVLAGSPVGMVKVTLIWGKEATDRQTVTIATLGAAYGKLPIALHRQGRL